MVSIHCHVLLSVVATPRSTYLYAELMAFLMPLLVVLDAPSATLTQQLVDKYIRFSCTACIHQKCISSIRRLDCRPGCCCISTCMHANA